MAGARFAGGGAHPPEEVYASTDFGSLSPNLSKDGR